MPLAPAAAEFVTPAGIAVGATGAFSSAARPVGGVVNLRIGGRYKITPQPISIFVDGIYANGISSAYAGAVGFPGET